MPIQFISTLTFAATPVEPFQRDCFIRELTSASGLRYSCHNITNSCFKTYIVFAVSLLLLFVEPEVISIQIIARIVSFDLANVLRLFMRTLTLGIDFPCGLCLREAILIVYEMVVYPLL